jgi:serine/threonine protein phosphatase PrpC
MLFTIFQESRRGSRKLNQDRIAYSYSRDSLLMVVADGMGGHVGGEIAAQIVARLLIERFQQEAKPSIANPHQFLQETMLRAHAALGHYANQLSMIESPRTTCVACIVQSGHAYWAHAGDSRFYLFRNGVIVAQTRDHSKVQYLLEQGLLTPQAAARHPDRNKVYSCLGGVLEPVIDVSKRTRVEHGDICLLCTDGVWGVMSDRELVRGLYGVPLLAAAPLLLAEAERRGGPEGDNLSAIAMYWGSETGGAETTARATITETMPLGEFESTIDRSVELKQRTDGARDLSDDEIEKAIQEIQTTIRRYSDQNAKNDKGKK